MGSENKRQVGMKTLVSTAAVAALVFILLQAQEIDASRNRSGKGAKRGSKACKRQVSKWNECSKTCGLGLSSRVKKKRCRPKLETRLCIHRPCENGPEELPRPSRACVANLPRRGREYIKYIKAKSEKKYRMRYCGYCADDTSKCCTPKKSKTKKIWFVRADGTRFSKKMMFIRKCHCHRNCKIVDGPSVDVQNDTLRE